MKISCSIAGQVWSFDMADPIDVSIPLAFDGEQPNAFGLPRASAVPFRAGGFVGDTREGGSVNCFDVALNPHGNGTHTECVGHIVNERVTIHETLRRTWIPSMLVTVPLVRLQDCQDTWEAPVDGDDWVIGKESLLSCLEGKEKAWCEGLLLRTTPNPESKQMQCYSGNNPPYISLEAFEVLEEFGVQHLLVDLPSVDRELDGGHLSGHHHFWGIPYGTSSVPELPSIRTITEMIYVKDCIVDGCYLLQLQIPPFQLDAAPSRPFLYAPEKRQSKIQS